MAGEIPKNLEKRENGFHFYSLPLLPLPFGERGRMRRYELKCSQFSSLYLIAAKIQRIAELTFKNWLIFCTILYLSC
jgi:hypothetical protein